MYTSNNMQRNFICTIQFDQKLADPCEALPDFTTFPGIKRATFQLERGAKTQRLHWQIFLEFAYPQYARSVYNRTAEQGITMHVRHDKECQGMHPCRGRNYVNKDFTAVKGTRYVFIQGIGWENNKEPTIKKKLQPSKKTTKEKKEEIKVYTKSDYMDWLKWQIKECQELIKSVDSEKIKII